MPPSWSANHCGRRRHHFVEARGPLGPLLRFGIRRRHVHPRLAGQLLDRIHEGKAARIGQEADRVAMRAAAEAMVEALFVVDGRSSASSRCGTGSRP